jgi:hypothetical protein
VTFADEVVARSALAYYKLDDSDPASVLDYTGNGRHLGWSGSRTLAQPSLLGDGSGFSVQLDTCFATTPNASWMHTSYVSVVLRYKPRSGDLTGDVAFLTRWLGGGATDYSWYFGMHNGQIAARAVNSSNVDSTEIVGSTTLVAGTTYTLGMSFNGTTVKVYVNGVSDGSVTLSGTLRTGAPAALELGRIAGGFWLGKGIFDELALFGTGLSDSDHSTLHAAAIATGSPVTVTAPVAVLSVATPVPTVTAGSTVSVDAPVMAVTIAAPAPTVQVATPADVAPPVMAVTVTALAPTVTAGATVTVAVPAAALTFAVPAPTVATTDGTPLSVAAPTMAVTIAMPGPTVSGVEAVVPTSVARVYTPSGAMALIPLVAVTPPATEEPIERCSVVMAALSETHPVHARRDCLEGDDTVIREVIGYPQLWIGGRNVTYLRDTPTVVRRWESEVPFGDTAAAFEFPQLNPWDADGVGDLDFLTKDAPVAIGIADDEGNVRRVWSGFLDARGNGIGEGEDYAREAKGTLWAAMHTVREPFPFTQPIDIGILIARTLNEVTSKRWADMPETPIGIVTLTRGSRDQKHFEYVQELLSEAWTDDGRQWTLYEPAPGVFALMIKPLPSTVHATVAYGTPGVEIDLRVDESTRVDAVYARAIAPNKGGWANMFYPATELLNPPPYPNADPDQYLNLGTSDSDTDSLSGVTDWQTRVVEIGTFDTPAISGVMSAAWVAVAEEVQASVGVTVDGSVGPQTWNATFDRGGEGIDLRPIRLPLAMKPWVWPTLHTAAGVVSGPNPAYTGTASVPRMIAVDLGADKTKSQGRVIARNLLSVYGEAEAFGTAQWVFDPNEIDRTQLTHLSNVKILGHEGEDRTLMVVRKTVELEKGESGPVYVVTTTLDQRARDAMAVEDLLEQRRSAEADPSRRPGNPPKSSRQVADQRTPWDSESPCGVLRRTAVNGSNGLPSVITIPFAEVGKLARIELTSTQPFAFMLCASLRITENIAQAIVGDPFASSDPWRDVKDQLDEYGVIEAWGEMDNACGYSPKTEPTGDFTGSFILDTPVDYWTETIPYVSLVVWMRGDSGFISGRFFPAYEGA